MACADPPGPPPRPGKVDIDALWLALKARTAVARAATLLPPPPPPPPQHKRGEEERRRQLNRPEPAPPFVVGSGATVDQLLERMARALKPRERLEALEAVAAAAACGLARRNDDGGGGGGSSDSRRRPGALEVGKALVRRAVDDPSEAVRERAANALADLMLLRPDGTGTATTAGDRADSDDDDAPRPPLPAQAVGPSSCPPPPRVAPLTDAQAQELLLYIFPGLTERLVAERPRSGVFQQRRPQQRQPPPPASRYELPEQPPQQQEQERQAAPAHEPSEEVRLALLRAFAAVVRRCGASRAFAPYGADALAVVERAASTRRRHGGGSPAAHLAACDLARCLERAMGPCLQPIAMPLATALAALTASRRSTVRAAAVHTLAPLAHRGAHEAALLLVGHRDPHVVPIRALAAKVGGADGKGGEKNDNDKNDDDEDDDDIHARLDLKANFCGRLSADPSPRVRLAFVGALLRDWLTRLPGRRDHEARLVPFVLGALVPHSPRPSRWEGGGAGPAGGGASDKDADRSGGGGADDADSHVAAAAAALLEDLGAQHECDVAHEHHEDDPLELETERTRTPGVAYAGSAAAAAALEGPASVVLAGPFASRPSRGTRALCSGAVLSGMVGAACAELSEAWQPSVRWRSAALMAVTLVVVEAAADRHLPTIVPALCKALLPSRGGGVGGGNGADESNDGSTSSSIGADEEAAAALRWSRRCCEVLGVFCDGEALWALLRPLCCGCDEDADPRRQAAAVSVLALAVRGARAAAAARRGGGATGACRRPLLARRALEMVEAEEEGLRDVRDVGLSAAVQDLVREAGGKGE